MSKARKRSWARKGLSPREVDVIKLVFKGRTNPQIATTLKITAATVKVHVKSALLILNLANRTQLAVWWWKHHQGPTTKKEPQPCPQRPTASASSLTTTTTSTSDAM